MMPYCAPGPFMAVPCGLIDGIFIGATQGRVLRNAAIVSAALYLATELALRDEVMTASGSRCLQVTSIAPPRQAGSCRNCPERRQSQPTESTAHWRLAAQPFPGQTFRCAQIVPARQTCFQVTVLLNSSCMVGSGACREPAIQYPPSSGDSVEIGCGAFRNWRCSALLPHCPVSPLSTAQGERVCRARGAANAYALPYPAPVFRCRRVAELWLHVPVAEQRQRIFGCHAAL